MATTRKNTLVQKDDDEPRIDYRGIKAMPFIIANETFEKLGAIGTQANLQVYLTTVFNMKRINATNLLNVFHGTTNLATLAGAYVCDTYLGRYKTLRFGSIASFMGLLLITLTAAFKNLHPPHCGPEDAHCVGPTAGQTTFLLTGFGLLIIGAGSIRPCKAFGVDQFDPNTDSGKRGIDSFFNWYYFTVAFAHLVAVTLVTNLSWPIGLGIPALFMLISCFLFFVGTKIYVLVAPEGSPLTSISQVVVAAAKKRRLRGPQQLWLSLFNYTPVKSINSRLAYTEQFRFLDKAAILTPQDQIKPDGSPVNPWQLCTMQQVEQVKCVMRVIPIWAATILYHVGEKQQYMVFQAMQSDRHLGNTRFQIPPATYAVFSLLTVTVWVPVYDRAIVPFFRRVTGKPDGITILQRIGVGMALTILESLISAFVEERRWEIAISNPMQGVVSKRGAISSMSAMWLVPQLSLAGLAESFSAIGQFEFYYKQFPENMRSIAGSFFFLGMAAANYVNTFLISIVHRTTEGSSTGNWLSEDLNKGRLDYFYYLVTGLCLLNFCYFLVCAKWYRYKGTSESVIDVEIHDI